MGLFAFFAGVGFIDIAFFSLFFIAMVISCTLDSRYDREDPKWWLLIAGFLIIAGLHWNDWTFFKQEPGHLSLWEFVRSAQFWIPVAWYLGLGLIYSVVEFMIIVPKSRRKYAADWEEHITGSKDFKVVNDKGDEVVEDRMVGGGSHSRHDAILMSVPKTIALTHREVMSAAREFVQPISAEQAKVRVNMERILDHAKDIVRSFVSQYRYKNRIIELKPSSDGLTPTQHVNKAELAEHIGAWILLWPFYLVSLIIGDLLTEIFHKLADFFVHLSGRYVAAVFKDAFKA